MDLITQLKKISDLEVVTDAETLLEHSRDTSLFIVKPEVVVYPKNSAGLQQIVKFVAENKQSNPKLSLTARSAGTDMTGGPLNESIIVNFTKYFNQLKKVDPESLEVTVCPGVYYRDLETALNPYGLSLPTYPASKSIAALGGMVANNAGGEKTLRYGKTANFVKSLKVVLSDGNEYTFSRLTKNELEQKKKENSFEGEIYTKLHSLLEQNAELIKNAKPTVSKNSAGYALWDIWDGEFFDLTKLFVGAQGTLGLVTEIKFALVKNKPKQKLIALFLKSWDELPSLVNDLLPFEPESLEAFDDETLKLGLRFMPEVAKKAGVSFWRFATRFWPEFLIGVKMLGLPKLIILVQLAEDTEVETNKKTSQISQLLKKRGLWHRILATKIETEKYWLMRRESFNLLRQHVKGKKTAPFIEDFCVKPIDVPKFLPEAIMILKKYKINLNIAGHAGNGNFHIIPLMDLTKISEREKIVQVADEFYDLVAKYRGSITAEHNDGIIRTPYLSKMYGEEVCALFAEVKNIFDPQNIFNPGKKVGGTIEYLKAHIAKN